MKNLILSILAALILVIAHPAGFAQAQVTSNASLSFNPPGGTIPKDTEFTIDVMVNTGGQDSAGADVTVKYETAKLDFVSGVYPTSSTFYPLPIIQPIAANSGKISMARTVATPGSGGSVVYTNGTGIFAKLTFKTKSTVQIGDSTTLSFEYTAGATNDFTNVANATTPAADLLGSSTLPTATYVVAAAAPINTNPVITSIAPSSGSAKNTVGVTINGLNFGEFVSGSSKVYLGTKLVNIISWTPTQIQIEVAAEPDLKADSVRQVKVHRADGAEATYTGYRLVGSGPEVLIWGGLILSSLLAAWFVYRKVNILSPVAGAASVAAMPLPIMNYQPDSSVTQVTYRNWQ